MREEYDGSITVGFSGMPSIQLESYVAHKRAGLIERLSIATKRRRFTMKEDWEIDLGRIDYQKELNGTIVIPKREGDVGLNVFDGASVPVPWLVSLLSVGILRPLGVMLIGSILHDYAYKYGSLKVRIGNRQIKSVNVDRHNADKLFRDVIGTINNLPAIGYLGWMAVRIGWLWVPYNGAYRTGRVPYIEYLFVAVAFGVCSAFWYIFDFRFLIYCFFGVYMVFYVASLILQKRYSYNLSQKT